MDLTQESILGFLVAEGGQVKKSDLVAKFKASVECVDPAEKLRNRELFKTCVNNVSFVKEIDGARWVVLKKAFRHLLQTEGSHEGKGKGEGGEIRPPGEQQQRTEDPARAEQGVPAAAHGEDRGEPEESLSVVQLALLRSKSDDLRVKRMLNFDISKQEAHKEKHPREAAAPSSESRPYGLPLRIPPSATKVEHHKLKDGEPPEISKEDTFRSQKRPSQVEPGRPVKKAPEVSRVDSRTSSLFPLEQVEHDLLVKSAAGHWAHVYGLLLSNCHLIEKKDFMSGFTVLHWAAKTGNSQMLVKLIDASKQGGVDVDVNVKSHGGYTPLHIAALHDQEYVMAMLVGEYGADVGVRDNCGKRAHHYLHNGISPTVREMLGGPKVQQQAPDKVLPQKEEDPSKGLHSISRLFQPTIAGQRKKQNPRSGLYSVTEDGEERDQSPHRQRTWSNASAC
ncbi:ankyrin repeat domain-containing protein SOWAHA-like [Kryptolebias marmoratus]|uniref:ankyrin repeat domain-containing protein SOWAHA-like n=1 Tax=Kryptolebias marmoratus TaxID=37003 RepID=UPI0007F9293F|nr:ankyrin repeat domain-containing protein SOWAHA-like [Kryptolebias marmoratus]